MRHLCGVCPLSPVYVMFYHTCRNQSANTNNNMKCERKLYYKTYLAISPSLVYPLKKLFDKTLSIREIPDILKVANVTALYTRKGNLNVEGINIGEFRIKNYN